MAGTRVKSASARRAKPRRQAVYAVPASVTVVAPTIIDAPVREPLDPFDAAARFHQDNLGALIESGRAVLRGAEDLGWAWLNSARQSIDDGAGATAQAMAARSLAELADRQQAFLRDGLARLNGEGARLSLLSLRLADEAIAPLRERFAATAARLRFGA